MTLPALINDNDPLLRSTGDIAEEEVRESAILHRSLHNEPATAVYGSGIYIKLEDGTKILDATGGAAVACLGHRNIRVLEAIQRQLTQICYVHTHFFSTRPAEALAAELIDSTNGHMAKAFIVSSGSEAMEAAMKLARQYYLDMTPAQPKRSKFIARRESYHGITLGALSMGGHLHRRELFEPMLLSNVSRVSACNEYREMSDGDSVETYVAKLAKELDDEFHRVGPDQVCAFVAEPVVGAALGCVPSVPGYFQAMKAVCDKHGALLIFDEVMSGMGRTGTLHAWEQEGVVPDIQTIGKGLGGGYLPVAGLLIGHKVVNALDEGPRGAFRHGQTYQGHAIACAAALEVQRVIKDERLLDNVRKMGDLLGELLNRDLETHPHVGNVRGRGLFWGIEFVRDKVSKEPFNPNDKIANRLYEKGIKSPYFIQLYPGNGTADGISGDHLLLAPAYNVSQVELECIAKKTVDVIKDFFSEFAEAMPKL